MKSYRKNLKHIMTLAAFLLFIFGFTIASMLSPDKKFSQNENRVLAQKPELSFADIKSGEYSKDYETYITDQFVGRDKWIYTKSIAELMMLKREMKGVFIGKDGYLIEKHSIEDEEQAEKNYDRVASFVNKYTELLGKDNVKLMLVPSAAHVLTDKLPKYASSYDEDIIVDKILEKLTSKDSFVDVRNVLANHKDEYIYYKTDHHYTTLGAYYAYTEWAKATGHAVLSLDELDIRKVSEDFYGTVHSKLNLPVKPDEMYTYTPKNITDVSVVYDMDETTRTDSLYEQKHLETKDKYSLYLDGNHPFVQITTGNKNGEKILIIKDSFAHSFVPFLTAHYEEIIMVDFRYFRAPISSVIDEYGITDVLVLYNTMKFANDSNTLNFTK